MLNQRGTGRHSPPTEPPASREKRQSLTSLFIQANGTPTLRCPRDVGLPSHEVAIARVGWIHGVKGLAYPHASLRSSFVGDLGKEGV